jgi:hypothetical protein
MTTFSEDDEAALRSGIVEFASALENDVTALTTIEDLLRAYVIDAKPDDKTMQRLSWSLSQVASNNGGFFLSSFLAADNPGELLNRVADQLKDDQSAKCRHALQRLQALFGFGVADAMRRYDQNLDGWAFYDREIYFDVLANRWVLHIVLTKYDESTMRIVSDPDSALSLGTNMVRSINLVRPPAFDPAVVTEFRGQVTSFLDQFDDVGQPKASAESDGAGSDAPNTADAPAERTATE